MEKALSMALALFVVVAAIGGGYLIYGYLAGKGFSAGNDSEKPQTPQSGTMTLYFHGESTTIGATEALVMDATTPSAETGAIEIVGLFGPAIWVTSSALDHTIKITDVVRVNISYTTAVPLGVTTTATLYDVSPDGNMTTLGSDEQELSFSLLNAKTQTYEITDAVGSVIEEGHYIGIGFNTAGFLSGVNIIYDAVGRPSGIESLAWVEVL